MDLPVLSDERQVVLGVGMIMLAVFRARNDSKPGNYIFSYFKKTIPIILVTILYLILVTIGSVLLILPGIYLMVSYMFASALVVD